MDPSFFFTNRTGAPQGDTLGRIKPLSKSFWICFFNSSNSIGAILYGGLEIGAVPSRRSIVNLICLFSDSAGRSLGKTSGKSHTMGMSSNIGFLDSFLEMKAKYP
ncbi:unnamed protein product [Musa textilis]